MGRAAIIVPARFGSTRFPGKPLALLKGPDGVSRPALCYTWSAALTAAAALGSGTRCKVATDDNRIAEFARAHGMDVIMTPESCRNGTERCASALEALGEDVDLVVNLQGDAPLTPAAIVREVVQRLDQEQGLSMATAAVPLSPELLALFQRDAEAGRVGGTTVVLNARHQALYFSKSIIPHIPRSAAPTGNVLLHLGIYAYRPAALKDYIALEPGIYEEQEGLEQLRFLEAGMPVGVCICEPPSWAMIELNNPTDVPLIERELAEQARHMNR